jgi:hypothetical protein
MRDQRQDFDLPGFAFPQERGGVMKSESIQEESRSAIRNEILATPFNGQEENGCGAQFKKCRRHYCIRLIIFRIFQLLLSCDPGTVRNGFLWNPSAAIHATNVECLEFFS